MALLEKEIARLEEENNKLKRDTVEYENKLAIYSRPTRLAANFPTFNRVLETAADDRAASKLERSLTNTLRQDDGHSSDSTKKKLRVKTLETFKKRNVKK